MGEKRKNQDRIVGIAILLVGGFLWWETYSFRTTEWEPLGMAFWPRLILGLMGAIAVYFVVKGSVDDGPYTDINPRAFLILLGGMVFVLCMHYFGFLLVAPVFIFVFTALLGGFSRRNLIHAAVTAVLCTLCVYLIFQKGLLIQLPEAFWE